MPVVLVLEDAIRMAIEAGTVMGRPGELAQLRAGQLADIVVLDTSGPHHLGGRHPVPSAALRGRASDIRTVVVNGIVVVDEFEVTAIDMAAANAQALAVLSV